jgi:serine/threonine-protein kinase
VTQSGIGSAQVVREGEILAGKYQVERVLGVGGMGVVVAAHHIGLNTKVAIKFLLPEMLKSKDIVARFAREAQAAVRITSEHVARVHDVGTLETGAPYMVMEYLEGGDLAAWLQQRGPLPVEQAVEFVLQACVAVAEAHGLGIVHRDLKPANLFCVRRADGRLSIKVLDFGISKVTDVGLGPATPGAAVTRTTAMLGTPLYMSPEHMQSSKSADAQSDIWSLGVILFELLAGRVPFDGESVAELAVKTATQPPPSLRGFRPDVPPGLETVISRCLERDRAQRYRNVAQLAVDLLPFASRRATASVEQISGIIQASGLSLSAITMPATPQVADPLATAGTEVPLSSTTPGVPGARSRRRAAVAGVVLVGALVLAGGGFAVKAALRGKQAPPAPAVGLVSAPPAPATSEPAVTASTAPTQPDVPAAPSVAAAATTPAPARPTSPSRPASAQPSRPAAAAAQAAASSPAARPASPPATPAALPSCDPPYVLDAEGQRHYKPECYLNR